MVWSRAAFRAYLTVRAAPLLALTVVACSREAVRVPPDAGHRSSHEGPESRVEPPLGARLDDHGRGSRDEEPALVSTAAEASRSPSGTGEALRSVLPALERDALLRPQLAGLRAHFGPQARGPYAMQRVELAAGRTALLLAKADETEPVVLTLDRDQLVWSRLRPTAGIALPLVHLAIAARPDGGVALFGYVASMRLVVSRMWAEEGSPFADSQVFAPTACDALSAAYGPEQGWWVACASNAGAYVQRVRENGTTAWGDGGALLGIAAVTGPVTIVFDTPSTAVLLQRARGVAGDHLFASRYAADARPLWPLPVDMGVLPQSSSRYAPSAEDRLRATSSREGVVYVELPRGLEGKRARAAEIGSAGDVRWIK